MVELIPEKVGPWTFDDLADLPDELCRRVEISDGVLEVSPPPAFDHQGLAALLATELNNTLLPGRLATLEVGIDLGRSYRVPDISVVGRRDLARGAKLLQSDWVDLVVEIVSPDSETRDRVTKPTQYAAFGIPAYWRIETDGGVVVTAHALLGDRYVATGSWADGETLAVDAPFAFSVAIHDLVP